MLGGHAEFSQALLADDVDDVIGCAVGLNLVRRGRVAFNKRDTERNRKLAPLSWSAVL